MMLRADDFSKMGADDAKDKQRCARKGPPSVAQHDQILPQSLQVTA